MLGLSVQSGNPKVFKFLRQTHSVRCHLDHRASRPHPVLRGRRPVPLVHMIRTGHRTSRTPVRVLPHRTGHPLEGMLPRARLSTLGSGPTPPWPQTRMPLRPTFGERRREGTPPRTARQGPPSGTTLGSCWRMTPPQQWTSEIWLPRASEGDRRLIADCIRGPIINRDSGR